MSEWLWPQDDKWCRLATEAEVGPAMSWLKAHNRRWGTVIQAGGNTGVFAKHLGEMFDYVVTVEPDAENFKCLRRNLWRTEITRIEAALGPEMGFCQVQPVDANNCGAHRVVGGGSVRMITIDNLDMDPDLIWLDIEGSELGALQGAQRTIGRTKPMIIVEQKGLGRHYGYDDADLTAWLERMGYHLKSQHENDRMYT